MRPPVTSKIDMYRRLAAGEFGNTSPQFFDLWTWTKFKDSHDIKLWGIRTMTGGNGPARLNVQTRFVGYWWWKFTMEGHNCQVSAMVDEYRTAVFNVWESPSGLVVEGKEYPERAEEWRSIFAGPLTRWAGIQARMVLKRHLNENSYDDLMLLLDEYPDHIVEMTTLNRCFGTVPHRNACVWEVRAGGELYKGY